MASPDIQRAARLAAQRLEAMLVDMLTAGETGEVAAVVDFNGLQPVKRVATKGKIIPVARGRLVEIEKVG